MLVKSIYFFVSVTIVMSVLDLISGANLASFFSRYPNRRGVKLYLYSPFGPQRPVIGRTLPTDLPNRRDKICVVEERGLLQKWAEVYSAKF